MRSTEDDPGGGSTWQAAALSNTGVIESLKSSIFTFDTEAARVSAQRGDRLETSERIIFTLQVAIHARDREIARLTCRLAESRSQQAAIHGVATAYFRQLQEFTKVYVEWW